MRERRVLRYEVPVDDQWHELTIPAGPLLHVATRRPEVVEFWTVDHGDDVLLIRWFRVFGTGHPLPDDRDIRPVGSAIVPGGELVWHLFEVDQ